MQYPNSGQYEYSIEPGTQKDGLGSQGNSFMVAQAKANQLINNSKINPISGGIPISAILP